MINKISAKLVDIDISNTYSNNTVDAAMNNFGCLAGIMTEDKYLQRTTLDWEEPTKPDYYDTNITNAMHNTRGREWRKYMTRKSLTTGPTCVQ